MTLKQGEALSIPVSALIAWYLGHDWEWESTYPVAADQTRTVESALPATIRIPSKATA